MPVGRSIPARLLLTVLRDWWAFFMPSRRRPDLSDVGGKQNDRLVADNTERSVPRETWADMP